MQREAGAAKTHSFASLPFDRFAVSVVMLR